LGDDQKSRELPVWLILRLLTFVIRRGEHLLSNGDGKITLFLSKKSPYRGAISVITTTYQFFRFVDAGHNGVRLKDFSHLLLFPTFFKLQREVDKNLPINHFFILFLFLSSINLNLKRLINLNLSLSYKTTRLYWSKINVSLLQMKKFYLSQSINGNY